MWPSSWLVAVQPQVVGKSLKPYCAAPSCNTESQQGTLHAHGNALGCIVFGFFFLSLVITRIFMNPFCTLFKTGPQLGKAELFGFGGCPGIWVEVTPGLAGKA